MSIKTNHFNSVARFYDLLSGLVFGKALKKSQAYFLPEIPARATVLIVGGGTGWFLPEVIKQSDCRKIIYIEPSSEMVKLARKRIQGLKSDVQIEFIEAPIEKVALSENTDVLITYYVLDLFKEEKLDEIMHKLYANLKPGGLWMFVDFAVSKNINRYWQEFLIRIMYLFFRFISRIEADQLPDFKKHFGSLPLKKQGAKKFFSEMMESIIYQKPDFTA